MKQVNEIIQCHLGTGDPPYDSKLLTVEVQVSMGGPNTLSLPPPFE